ncbi:MAG: hypothetical protein ACQESC_02145 [Nanobdellota archaeon]
MKKHNSRQGLRILKQWAFPLITLIIIGITTILSPDIGHSTVKKAGNILLTLLPIFILVIVIMTLSRIFLSGPKVKKQLGRESGLKGTLLSVGAGIISTGAIYMWYPLLAELQQKGMSWKNITIFLYNRSIKLQLLPVMLVYFSTTFVITLLIVTIIISFIQGSVLGYIFDKSNPITTTTQGKNQ